jgi:L-arabonate dehydrase
MKKSNPKQRSIDWFGRQDIYGFIYRSWMKNRGVPDDMFDGRPVIGICNTWSELTPCNTHFRVLADHVRQGVLEAGGFPLEFPVMSLGETLMRPTAMLYRNLASMDVEEIAALACWLASADCSFSTGAVFDISGGRATY